MQAAKEVILSSTAHGIPNVIRNKHKLIKIVWLISILVSLGGLGYFTTKTIINFLNYDVVTNINKYKDISTQFPTITFCFNSSIELGDILISCEFNLKSCNESDFEESKNYHEKCFRFNSGKNKNNKPIPLKYTNRTDLISGLKVLFNYDKWKTFYDSRTVASLYVCNHTNYFSRDLIYNIESGIPITPGVTIIQVEREFQEQLSYPYNHCVKQDTKSFVSGNFQIFNQFNLNYMQKDCIDICVEKFVEKKCNCIIPYCEEDEIEDETCASTLLDNFKSSDKEIPRDCFQECPPECDRIYYRLLPYYIGSVSKSIIDKHKLTEKSFDQENLVYIYVYYSTLEYTLIKQIPKTEIFDIISNIGGILGLFLGISFLSFVEIFELFYEFIYNILKSNKKQFNVI